MTDSLTIKSTTTIPQAAESEIHPVTVIPHLDTEDLRADVMETVSNFFNGRLNAGDAVHRLQVVSIKAIDYRDDVLNVLRRGKLTLGTIADAERRILREFPHREQEARP